MADEPQAPPEGEAAPEDAPVEDAQDESQDDAAVEKKEEDTSSNPVDEARAILKEMKVIQEKNEKFKLEDDKRRVEDILSGKSLAGGIPVVMGEEEKEQAEANDYIRSTGLVPFPKDDGEPKWTSEK